MAKTKQKGILGILGKLIGGKTEQRPDDSDAGKQISKEEKAGDDITSPSPKVAKIKAGTSPARKKLNAIIERKRAARGNN